MQINILNNKKKFIDLYNTHIVRDGSKNLLKWLNQTDFFEAPASTKYHSSFSGGLCFHSLNVFKLLSEDKYHTDNENMETIAIISLLHDICKCNFYSSYERNVKNNITNQWEKVCCYKIDDKLPLGHAEKSIFLIQNFMKLNINEALAIRWHMGPFYCKDIEINTLSLAFGREKLALRLFIADIEATYLYENIT